MNSLTATVVISTKDRREELRAALESALAQRPACGILVLDDGSSDGTASMVRREYPRVRVERSEVSRGYIQQRNLGARLSTTDVVFSIDDDAAFSAPDVVDRTLREFDDDPRIGAVAIPFVNVSTGPAVLQRAPDAHRRWVTDSFIGTAYAVRRELFLGLGGFRDALVHQGEEGDYCIRMLDAGFFVRLGSAPPILHRESPRRSHERMDYYGTRNLILFSWSNVPMPYLPGHLAATTGKALLHSLRWPRLRGIAAGYRSLAAGRLLRAPVRRETYLLSRALRKRGPLDLELVAGGR